MHLVKHNIPPNKVVGSFPFWKSPKQYAPCTFECFTERLNKIKKRKNINHCIPIIKEAVPRITKSHHNIIPGGPVKK